MSLETLKGDLRALACGIVKGRLTHHTVRLQQKMDGLLSSQLERTTSSKKDGAHLLLKDDNAPVFAANLSVQQTLLEIDLYWNLTVTDGPVPLLIPRLTAIRNCEMTPEATQKKNKKKQLIHCRQRYTPASPKKCFGRLPPAEGAVTPHPTHPQLRQGRTPLAAAAPPAYVLTPLKSPASE